jgi:hypothetical protein
MSDNPVQGFTLNNRDEVIRFESLADAYAQEKISFPLKHISLVDAYDYCQTRDDGAKLFTALFDIYINFLMLYSDSMSGAKEWGDSTLENGSILDSESKFFRKMEMHKFNTSFIFRYRALWDKLMGFTVLFFFPIQYEAFVKAKSRRSSFKKIFSSNQFFPNEFIVHLDSHLDGFDNKLRTPEAHGTGALRKRSFAMCHLLESPIVEFGGHWNFILLYIVAIGKLFPSNKQNLDKDGRI